MEQEDHLLITDIPDVPQSAEQSCQKKCCLLMDLETLEYFGLPCQLLRGFAEEPKEGGVGGGVPGEPGLRGRHAGLLEPHEPRVVTGLMTDSSVDILEHSLVDFVGEEGEKVEHQPGGAVDMDLVLDVSASDN